MINITPDYNNNNNKDAFSFKDSTSNTMEGQDQQDKQEEGASGNEETTATEDDLMSQLEELWNSNNGKTIFSDEQSRQESLDKTRKLLLGMVNELIQDGIQAHREWEQTHQQLKMAKEDCASKTHEIERLRASDLKSRESISNLLRTVGSSNEETRDHCQYKLVEARLRADLLHLSENRDEGLAELAKKQRRCKLLEDDLIDTRAKLARVQQEKMQVERDQQATMSLANALQGNANSDIDYYKRKVTEQNTHIQGLSAILTEKNCQIETFRREKERSMSQNRLASYRAEQGGRSRKKSRFSV